MAESEHVFKKLADCLHFVIYLEWNRIHATFFKPSNKPCQSAMEVERVVFHVLINKDPAIWWFHVLDSKELFSNSCSRELLEYCQIIFCFIPHSFLVAHCNRIFQINSGVPPAERHVQRFTSTDVAGVMKVVLLGGPAAWWCHQLTVHF